MDITKIMTEDSVQTALYYQTDWIQTSEGPFDCKIHLEMTSLMSLNKTSH